MTYDVDKSSRKGSAIEWRVLCKKTWSHLSIDFHFDINDRKVESTDKPGVDEGVDKNNCALFK